MSTTVPQTAELAVPAAYVEDFRSAMIAEIVSDGDQLRANHAELVENPGRDPEDRDAAIDILARDLRVLATLAAATGDVQLTSEHDIRSCPLVDALHMMIRQLAERLTDASQFAPIPMRDVLDVAERLQWAATEAVRIEPRDDDRATDEERALFLAAGRAA